MAEDGAAEVGAGPTGATEGDARKEGAAHEAQADAPADEQAGPEPAADLPPAELVRFDPYAARVSTKAAPTAGAVKTTLQEKGLAKGFEMPLCINHCGAMTKGVYVGEVDNNFRPHGYGVWAATQVPGARYEGMWKEGKRHGQANVYGEDGVRVSVGFHVNGVPKGNCTVYTFQGKKHFSGNLEDCASTTGKGTLFVDGFPAFDGDIVHGKPHGTCKEYRWCPTLNKNGHQRKLRFQRSNSETRRITEAVLQYDGDWVDGTRHGTGKLYDENGVLQYEGEFANGAANGKGTHYMQTQSNFMRRYRYYVGDFVEGEMSGTGRIYDEEGDLIYEGDVQGGKSHGYGREYFARTRVARGEDKDGGVKFLGKFKAGERVGQGVLYNEKGDMLMEGYWCEGRFAAEH